MVSVYSDDVPQFVESSNGLKISPSAAERWIRCPGSAWASRVAPKFTNPAAQEGTCAHKVLEFFLKYPKTDPENIVGIELDISYYGDGSETWTTDREMVKHAMRSVAGISEEIRKYSGGEIFSETKTRYTHNGMTSNGRCDIFSIDYDIIVCVDFKYGKRPVSPCENYELILYVLSLRQQYGPRPFYRLGIDQPRSYGTDGTEAFWWVLSDADLSRYESTVNAALDRVKVYPAAFVSGGWCGYCPAKLFCPAVCMDLIQARILGPRNEDQLPNLWALKRADEIRKILGRLEKDAQAFIEAGVEIPGWTVAEVESPRRSWIENVKEKLVVRALENGWKRNDVLKTIENEITITEAEKLGLEVSDLTEKKKHRKLVETSGVKDNLKGF